VVVTATDSAVATINAVPCALFGRGDDRRGVGEPGFDPSSLVYWRRRMADSKRRPHRVNDAVKAAGRTDRDLPISGRPGRDGPCGSAFRPAAILVSVRSVSCSQAKVP